MNPIFLDIHIHTSENPNNINMGYDVKTLLSKIKEVSQGANFLISLTDHNVINKVAYLKLLEYTQNVLLGVEIHIKNHVDRPAYHCHIIFNVNITKEVIDDINDILDKLYPDKVITPETDKVPNLEVIINSFDNYDFILLPHGGQSHSTFDKSVGRDTVFDTTLERSIYYNQFDGFTARSNEGLESTVEYFKRLGINEFVNLITCTDNYNPNIYPNAKVKEASEFIPTWMMAEPTFDGVRLSLSEASRLIYSKNKPNEWCEYIKGANLVNDEIDIDVKLTPGLNVVIGGSSSGKTLFVDSLYRKIKGEITGSSYEDKFKISDMQIDNPSGSRPHYISQNYIMKVIDTNNDDDQIQHIEIIKNVFPEDAGIIRLVNEGLLELKRNLSKLIESVKIIEEEQNNLTHIPVFSRLILREGIKENLIKKIEPSDQLISKMEYLEKEYKVHMHQLDEIKSFMKEKAFVEEGDEEVEKLRAKLTRGYEIANLEISIRQYIKENIEALDKHLYSDNQEQREKKDTFDKLIMSIRRYSQALRLFNATLNEIAQYAITIETQKVNSMGHTLYINNSFKLTKDKFLEVVNRYLKREHTISTFEEISPQSLFQDKFKKQSPKVRDYDDFMGRVYGDFEKLNQRKYEIITSEGKNFNSLSAGWKTSVLLDLLLGYEGDLAPLIIDQPEDNLATNYINHGLIDAIKKIKTKKQIILVSHNATIPMLGDAQNIILCENKQKIQIRSARLEGKIEDKSIVDYIADITDGGKPSIKKRVKKYNLKRFREE